MYRLTYPVNTRAFFPGVSLFVLRKDVYWLVLATSPENAPLMLEKEHNAFSWIVVPMWACPFLRDAAYFYRFCVFYAKYHPLLCLAEA